MIAEYAGNGFRFVQVVQMCRRAVSVDVVDVVRQETGVLNSQFYALGLLDAVRTGSRNVICVGVAAITADFAVNVGAALLSVF